MTSHSRSRTAPPLVRPRARKGEGDRLRAEILEATEDLLIETGSEEAVSIRAVADRVGVTPPSIYRHFEDKSALMYEVCGLEFERLFDMFQAAPSEPDTVRELARLARAYVQFAIDHPEHFRIMTLTRTEFTLERNVDDFIGERSAFRVLLESVEQLLANGAVRPEVSAMGSMEVSLLLWAGVHGLASLVVTRPGLPWPAINELVDHLLDLVLHGLVSPTPVPERSPRSRTSRHSHPRT